MHRKGRDFPYLVHIIQLFTGHGPQGGEGDGRAKGRALTRGCGARCHETGAACPRIIIDKFQNTYGVEVRQCWGDPLPPPLVSCLFFGIRDVDR